MGKLFTILRNAPKRTSALVAMLAAALIVPAALLAWGPDRPTYTVEHPADHVTFNSITNNPNIGDERNFVGIRESGTNNLWTDNMNVQSGKEYTVRVYVHNNAASSLNASGKGIAKDVVAKVNLPTTTGKSIQVDGLINSSNATPKSVWDQAVFSSSKDFNLAYVKGSLKFENNAFGAKGTALPESIFTNTGAKLGYNKLDGTIPGCFQYAGYVTFRVKPQFAQTANFTVSKEVSKHGANQWVENYTAQPGETVDYLIQYKNTGDVQQDNVVLRDKLPTGMSYVNDSTTLGNALHPSGIKTNNGITTTGLNIGSYGKGGGAWVIFSAKVAASDDMACGVQTLKNVATAETDYGNKSDSANVTVDNGECKPEPKYVCDGLSVTQLSRTSFKFNTAYTVENATFKSVTYVIRDANGTEIARTTDATYTQTKVGKYTVQAIVTVEVDGETKTVTSANCKKPFEVVAEEDKCPIPGKEHLPANSPDCKEVEKCPIPGKGHLPKDSPKCKKDVVIVKELPTTGPAETALSILGLGSLIASVGYYAASRRALIGR